MQNIASRECENSQSQARIASRVAHALNNSLGILAAARELLSEVPHDSNLLRACQIMDEVESGVQAVSDAMNVLSLSATELEHSVIRHAGRVLGKPEIDRIVDALGRTAKVQMAPLSPGTQSTVCPLDGEMLKSILVCMAVALRQECGRDVPIYAELNATPSDTEKSRGWAFDIGTDMPCRANSPALALSQHPCRMATEHAQRILPAAGIRLEQNLSLGLRLHWLDTRIT